MIEKIRQLLIATARKAQIELPPEIVIERSRRPEHGHFSTNLPLALARVLKKSPMLIGEELRTQLLPLPDWLAQAEVKAPGFLNFFLTAEALQTVIVAIREQGKDYGRSIAGQGKKAQVEFVSANPTGPLTVGHGRQAVLGDSVARILEWNGYQVDREYYYNDAGRQMRILGHSAYLRYRQLLGHADELPEDHYQGEYIREIAQGLVERYGDRYLDDPENDIFKGAAEEAVFADIRATLEDLDILFDRFYNEKSLYESGLIEDVLQRLQQKGASYEKDGAIWFRAGDYGAEEDRVLWKSVVDEATYRLPDIAYHETKLKRGYDLVVDIFGADHHATYPDVLAGLRALGYATDPIRVLIHQFVTLTKGGEKVKMSTRKANYVTLRELTEEVGKDVVRYFFIMRGAKSHLNFDLQLAKTEGEENPVFYLQYAHARIASILRNARHRKIDLEEKPDLSLLKEAETLALLEILSEFPELIALCANTLEPHHITVYLHKLATAFHKFYTFQRVIGDDEPLTVARLALVQAVKQVLANGLSVIGVSAPERM